MSGTWTGAAAAGLVLVLTSCGSTPEKTSTTLDTLTSTPPTSQSVQSAVSSDSSPEDFIKYAQLTSTAMGGCTPGTVVTCKDQVADAVFVASAFAASKYIADPRYATAANAAGTALDSDSAWLTAGCSQTFTDDCSFHYTIVLNSVSLMGASIKTATA